MSLAAWYAGLNSDVANVRASDVGMFLFSFQRHQAAAVRKGPGQPDRAVAAKRADLEKAAGAKPFEHREGFFAAARLGQAIHDLAVVMSHPGCEAVAPFDRPSRVPTLRFDGLDRRLTFPSRPAGWKPCRGLDDVW